MGQDISLYTNLPSTDANNFQGSDELNINASDFGALLFQKIRQPSENYLMLLFTNISGTLLLSVVEDYTRNISRF